MPLFPAIKKQTIPETGIQSQDIFFGFAKWIQIEIIAFVFHFSVDNKGRLVVKIGKHFFESSLVLPLIGIQNY
jgi:hypothetical protein